MWFTGIVIFYSFLCVVSSSLNDVEHIVIFMQENRAFDHYYGGMRGIRGFNDRAAPLTSNGRSIWFQPIKPTQEDSNTYMLPYHIDMTRTSASCMDAPQMDYYCDIAMWNKGLLDSWNVARNPGFGMSYFDRDDLPYYYALIDGFTIGDQYFQSTFTQTNPNRLFLFSGSNGLSTGNHPILDNTENPEGQNWTTVAEVLEANKISWRVYQERDNFDDNGFAWFHNFIKSKPGSSLYDKGMAIVSDLVTAFAADMDAGTLPQVSWIVGPTVLSEHATNHPAAGEDLSARLIAALKARPKVYAKTVFIINYDEGGQFFDHHWTPTPPVSSEDGKSTVDVSGELFIPEKGRILPIGMGFRVPLLIVSPWTRGGYVVSEVFDHTSVIQFVEKRFGVTVPTLSAWRRTVAGDLTSAFDFENPDYSWPDLPSTVGYVSQSNYECKNYPTPIIPIIQSMPEQEPGTRLSRTLPYNFLVTDYFNGTHLFFTINNLGSAGAAFYFYDITQVTVPPLKYTVSSNKILSDVRPVTVTSGGYNYDFTLHGPNGFVRRFSGFQTMSASQKITGSSDDRVPQASSMFCNSTVSYDVTHGNLIVTLLNNVGSGRTCHFVLTDNAYQTGGPWYISVTPQEAKVVENIPVTKSGNWYDVSVDELHYEGSDESVVVSFTRRYMGRIERQGCTSDPAVGNGLHGNVHAPLNHPLVPESLRQSIHTKFMEKLNNLIKPEHKDQQRCLLTDCLN